MSAAAYDMSNYWRIVTYDGGRIKSAWEVTRPRPDGLQIITAIRVVLMDDDHQGGLSLTQSGEIIVYLRDGQIDGKPIIRGRYADEALEHLAELEAAAVEVAAAVKWPPLPGEADQ